VLNRLAKLHGFKDYSFLRNTGEVYSIPVVSTHSGVPWAWCQFLPTPPSSMTTGEKFVGSKKSDKYHYPDCKLAKKILPDNQIWFSSSEEARAAGYVPCGVCNPP